MIAVRDMVQLEARAALAIRKRDGAVIDVINTELAKTNFLFIVIDNRLWFAARDVWLEKHGTVPCYAEEWK